MKVTRIFIPVITVHILLGTLFLQQACNNTGSPLSSKQAGRMPSSYYSEPIYIEEIDLKEKATRVSEVNSDNSSSATVAANQHIRQAPRRPAELKQRGEGGTILMAKNGDLSKEGFIEHEVTKGESLWLIARRHDTTVAALVDANGISTNSILKVGQKLKIPSHGSVMNLDNPALNALEVEGADYVIQKGDSLSIIANRFGVDIGMLKAVNHLDGNTIYAGKRITIPGATSEKVATVMASLEVEKVNQPARTMVARNVPGTGTHKVSSGETLSEIAKFYGVSLNELMALNNIVDARKLKVGQQLIIRTQNDFEAGTSLAKRRDVSIEEKSSVPQLNDAMGDDALFDLTEEAPIVHLTSTMDE